MSPWAAALLVVAAVALMGWQSVTRYRGRTEQLDGTARTLSVPVLLVVLVGCVATLVVLGVTA